MLQDNTNPDSRGSVLLDLKKVFQEEGLKLRFEKELDFSDEEFYGANPFTSPVKVSGTVENQDSIIKLRCRAELRYTRECDRCLDMASTDYCFDFEHIVTAKSDDESDELVFAPSYRLELYELLREDILLELPGKYLCRQECKGLCPKCGCNLNHGQCGCDLSEADPRLAALGELLEENE